MLWYKSWLDTRARFVVGVIVLILSACGTIFEYPQIVKLLPEVSKLAPSGELGRRIVESGALARTYQGYMWSQWFAKNLPQTWCLFSIILASGGLVAQTSHGAIFTLALPVTRERLLLTRAATVLGELFVLAIAPAVIVPIVSPLIGQTYPVVDVLAHGVALFVGGSVFFAAAFLMSSVFVDIWPPLLIVFGAVIVLAIAETLWPAFAVYTPFHVMGAESYFRGNGLPWLGMVLCAAASAAIMRAAVVVVKRRDF